MSTIVYTQAGSRMKEPVVVRLYDDRPRYAAGGLHHTAEAVRSRGRYGDDILLHINPDEFNQLRQAWGEPGINPQTGLPEYGLGKALKKIGNKLGSVAKKVITNPIVGKLAPIAANFFLPGVGGIIANAALGAVRGKLMGGNPLSGALQGTLAGGIGKLIPGLGGTAGKVAQNILPGDNANGGILGKIFGGGQNQGAGTPKDPGFLTALKGFFTNTDDQGKTSPAWGKIAGTGLGALALLKGIEGNQKSVTPPPLPATMTSPLAQMQFNRTQAPLGGRDLLHYGEDPAGEFNFFPNQSFTPKATGGGVSGPGSGRDDKIDALLSDGEYVVDAESVAMLGDGSLNEGAKRLDVMRANLRKHKGQALAKGKFSPDAKSPEEYMGKRFDEGGPVADQNPQLGVSQLPPVNSNQPAPLPNPQGQYADQQGAQDILSQLGQLVQPKQGSALLDKLMAGIKANEEEVNQDYQKAARALGPQMTQREMEAFLNQHGTLMGMGAPPGGVDDDDDDPFAKAKGGYVNTLEFWNKEKNRIGKQLESGNYDGPASVEVAELKKNRSVIKSKIAKKAKGGKIDIPHLRVIAGGKPKASLEERATQLENIQRIIDAYKQAQDAADKAKKDLGVPEPQGVDPYNNPAKARGGLLLAQNRVAQIRAKMKKAEGGPVQALTSFADRLEQSLKEGNTDRVTQIHNELNAFEPQMLDHYAKGGIIKPSQVLGILEKSRIPPAAWNPDSLRNVAEELRKLNPESPILKQYDAEVARAAARKAAAAAPSPTATIMAPAVGDQ